MTTDSNKIISGPSKYDLVLALFEGKMVSFRRADGSEELFRVSSVEREDGSGESWNIVAVGANQRFLIYFSTRTRAGRFVRVM